MQVEVISHQASFFFEEKRYTFQERRNWSSGCNGKWRRRSKKADKSIITKSNNRIWCGIYNSGTVEKAGRKADGEEHTQSLMCMEWVIFWIRCWKDCISEADRRLCLGELIDRGPDPAGVLDLAMERKISLH